MDTSEKIAVLAKLGWTQAAIGRATGISQATICRISKGNDPRASNAYAIDRLFKRVMSEKAAA